jgi:hypothetical protein
MVLVRSLTGILNAYAKLQGQLGQLLRKVDEDCGVLTTILHGSMKPRFGKRPMPLHGLFRYTQDGGDFGMVQTDKEAELHHLGLFGVFRGKPLEGLVDLQDDVFVPLAGQLDGIQVHTLKVAAVFASLPAAGAVHEDAAHHFGGHSVELLAVLPAPVRLLREPQPGFVNERSGLEGLAGDFAGHLVRSQTAQFVVKERQQLVRGLRVAFLCTVKNEGDFVHAAMSS